MRKSAQHTEPDAAAGSPAADSGTKAAAKRNARAAGNGATNGRGKTAGTIGETMSKTAAPVEAGAVDSNGRADSPVDAYARPGDVHFAPTPKLGMLARGQQSALDQAMVMLLAGGQGERLYPL